MTQTMTAPFFSICIPVYNPGSKLKICMDSILEQTCGDFELLCCDDKSTDGSLAVLQKYAAKDPRVKVLENAENCGGLSTRNRLFRQAAGQYSVWMDNDDWLAPDFFEQAYRILHETPCDILEFPYEIIYPDGHSRFIQRPRLLVESDHLSRFFLAAKSRPYVWYMWSKFFRTEIVRKSIPPDMRVCLDDVFYGIPLFHYAQSYCWAALDHPMYHYNFSNGSWSNFEHGFTLQKLHTLCTMRAGQIAYNTAFFFREHLPEDLLYPIINFADLESLTHLLGTLPAAMQPEALKVFFQYFCRGEHLLNDRPLNVSSAPVIERLKREMPGIDPAMIDRRCAG